MKKTLKFILVSVIYLLFDQGIKWAIETFRRSESDPMQIKSILHFHPVINDDIYLSVSRSAEKFSMPFGAALLLYFLLYVLAAVIICLILNIFSVKLFAGTKLDTSPRLSKGLTFIASAIAPVRTVDILLRGGTLDYLCTSRGMILHNADGTHESIIRHHSRDITDFLLYAAIILSVILFVKFIVSYLRYYKTKGGLNEIEIDRTVSANLKSIFKRK